MNTRDKLKTLFDFQGFSKSEKLDQVIKNTLSSIDSQMTEEELDMVNAAGTPDAEKNIPTMMVDIEKMKKIIDMNRDSIHCSDLNIPKLKDTIDMKA
ncbi:MAG: hypothetical protein KBT21_00645 [Treponema sp.]|nr:hypothetical protein [Candidatus Treponema merdequi]